MSFYTNRAQLLPEAPVHFRWALHDDIDADREGEINLRITCKRCGVYTEATWRRVSLAQMAPGARETERVLLGGLAERHPWLQEEFTPAGVVCAATAELAAFAGAYDRLSPRGRSHLPTHPEERGPSTYQGTGEPLRLWVIYKSPDDYPNQIVVRERHILHEDGKVIQRVSAEPLFAASVEAARKLIPPGAVRLLRAPEDVRSIVETWM